MKAPFCNRECEATAAYFCRLLVGGLAVLAFCTMLIATRWGIGLGPDSLVYIGVARSLLNGNGVTYLNDSGEFSPVRIEEERRCRRLLSHATKAVVFAVANELQRDAGLRLVALKKDGTIYRLDGSR